MDCAKTLRILGEGYQPLIGLQDIKKLQHLTEDAVRDILRSAYRDSDLKIVNMGQLTDMSVAGIPGLQEVL